ncbi:MAG: transposase [Fimbriimonadaceae bacterium]|nr:transposase [Fimbriimonadaceae bacterium]MCW5942475.1 transposase [Fimbriimonadaceae bacterium]MCW5944049.1 transposase [Fimbriimonadaceae bacterium]
MAERKRYTEEQILKVLGEIDAGASIASVSRSHGISDQTIYAWRKRFAGMSRSELAELKAMQEENRRLRHLVAELSLDNAALKELQRGKW